MHPDALQSTAITKYKYGIAFHPPTLRSFAYFLSAIDYSKIFY